MNLLEVFKNYDPDIISKPYVIAEAGVNHEGSMDLAKRLIDEACLLYTSSLSIQLSPRSQDHSLLSFPPHLCEYAYDNSD